MAWVKINQRENRDRRADRTYTQEEFDEIIGEYANTKLYQEGYQSGVKAEREACKNDIETVKKKYTYLMAAVCDDCIEAIDARGK